MEQIKGNPPQVQPPQHFHANHRQSRRWPGLVAFVLIGLFFGVLSERLILGPVWVMPLIIIVMLGFIIGSRLRGVSHKTTHRLALGAIGVVTMAIIISIVLLLLTLPDKSISAVSLLRDAALLWLTNVLIFALWYWQLDGGGPVQRFHDPDYRQHSDLLFPQLTLDPATFQEHLHWRPVFIDYVFVAFNTSTAFSPTDTPVLTTRVKILTMLQALISLVTLATLAARAINIL